MNQNLETIHYPYLFLSPYPLQLEFFFASLRPCAFAFHVSCLAK